LLLAAGVNAGLTLYDIAIMCCRNDNLGEVPSKLETLFSMASDLAVVAIENERWHHTTASRALVEQLTPDRDSLMSRDRSSSSYRFNKSASSAEFLSLVNADPLGSELDDDLSPEFARRGSPLMASSASDSSTDTIDANAEAEREECEEWAATVIADVGVDQMMAARRSRRSGSIASDDGSNDSGCQKGFWYIRPGSLPVGPSDDGSLSWSPHLSPRSSIADSSPILDEPLSLDDSARARTTTVRFVDALQNGSFLPPTTVSVSKFKSNGMDLPFIGFSRQESGMTRSKSYSALSHSRSGLSCTSTNEMVASLMHRTKPFTDEYENFHTYFLKFIDLVVAREMTAAVHQSTLSGEPSMS
jgi:hypothetical protein